jgi:ATP-dependent RNA helicase HelY
LRPADDISALERDHRLSARREADAGFAWAAFRWASGHRLEAVLTDTDLAAGDFVRLCKQLIDLLGQVANASATSSMEGDEQVTTAARTAVGAIRRGVVAVTVEE